MGLHPFSAVPTGFQELVNGESEEPVALAADAQVAAGGNAVGSFLSHDVHESPPAPELAGADAFDIQRHLGFVVEAGVPFVAVQCQLILVGDLFATLSSDEFKKTAAAKKNLCGCRSNWRLEAKKSPVVPGK